MSKSVAAGTDPAPDGSVRGATRRPSRWRVYAAVLGPGLVTGASDDDPSGVATYAQAGAQYRFGLLWTALITFPLMFGVQEICDRTALATGEEPRRSSPDDASVGSDAPWSPSCSSGSSSRTS